MQNLQFFASEMVGILADSLLTILKRKNECLNLSGFNQNKVLKRKHHMISRKKMYHLLNITMRTSCENIQYKKSVS